MYKQAVILAGGKGTRLRPLTLSLPKPMVPVAGFPFLYWQLTYLQRQGVDQVVLLVSHLAHVVREYFERKPIPGLEISYSLETTPMGTGGALWNALPHLTEKFWLLNGDSFLALNLREMAGFFAAHPWSGCLATARAEGVSGNLQARDSLVLDYRREAGFEFVDAGVYLLSRAMVEAGPQGTFDLGGYWPALIARKQLGAFPVRERFFDIGTPERLRIFEQHLPDYFS